MDIRFRGVCRFNRAASKELFTLSYDADYSLSNTLTLYDQNLVPPPADGQTFVTINSTDAVPVSDVVYSSTGVASSGVVTTTIIINDIYAGIYLEQSPRLADQATVEVQVVRPVVEVTNNVFV